MALSEEEKAQLEALMAKEKEPDDNEADEVWIQRPDGHTVGMSYKRGKAYLSSLGIDLSSVPVSDASGGTKPASKSGSKKADAGDDEGDPEQDPAQLRFLQRRQQLRDAQ